VVPLVSIKAQNGRSDRRKIWRAKFAVWPEAAQQVGLLDQDGRGGVDAFVDVPATNTFRLFRQRTDGR